MKKAIPIMFLLVASLIVVSACQGPAGPQGPEGPQCQAGEVAEEPQAEISSIVQGGLQYDKWWSVDEGAQEPTEDNHIWALQTNR